MKPEDKVVSLATAKRLKEAGFPQDTERAWALERSHYGVPTESATWGVSSVVERELLNNEFSREFDDVTAAPDAQEIGEVLPSYVATYRDDHNVYWCYDDIEKKFAKDSPNEAEARAAAWLWLKEQGLLTS